MALIQDDLGVWNQLGQVQVVHDQWVKFPVISNAGNSTFRVKLICVDPSYIRSYCYIRSRYSTANTDQPTQAIRIYPGSHPDEKFLIDLPINRELFDRTIYLRSIEIKKIIKPRRYLGVIPDIDYSISLEELW